MTWPHWSIGPVQIDPPPGDFDVRFVDEGSVSSDALSSNR
jgi:hypothetical protein